MASSIINSDDGVVSGTSGLKTTGGDDGVTAFQQNGTERMRIDSSGNVLISKTAIDNTAGIALRETGQIFSVRDGGTVCTLNRLTSDGGLLEFQKDGTTVGSIGSRAGVAAYIVLDPRVSGSGLVGYGQVINPCDETGTAEDATISLGDSSRRFKDLYLSGGVYVGGTGSANYLDDYEEGTWTATDASGAGITFLESAGVYVKIGGWVYVSNYILYPSTSSGAYAKIAGLPFTSKSVNANYVGSIGLNNTGLSNFYPFVHIGQAQIFMRNQSNADIANSTFSSKGFAFQAMYQVA